MYFDYEWVKEYIQDPPSLAEAARLLNQTGLETEIDGNGLEIEHTVNRPDAMNHFGVARELAVALDRPLIRPPAYEKEIPTLEDWTIETADVKECPQYIAVKVEKAKASTSPQWLVDRLTAIGQTSHNFLVDLTNFLLWEMGHPSHAFDADKLRGQKILIRPGRHGERLTTLDGRDHAAEGLLCIADAERPIAFAGVMGGQNTEVDDTTGNLLLELACFFGPTARRTGRECNIESDARHRFERGVDRENMDYVIRRFLHLLLQEQPEAIVVGMLDMNRAPFERTELTLRRDRIRQVLGVEIPDDRVAALLTAMDCRPRPNDLGWRVAPPGYKVDVEREIDVIEEIIRFAGLDLLRAELPEMGGSDFRPEPMRDVENEMRQCLTGFGMQEACTYSFQPESWDRGMGAGGEPARLRNPMSENQAVMRRFILPSLLDCARRNLNRGNDDLALYEIAHVYRDGAEPHHLAMVVAPPKIRNHWRWLSPAHPFYRVKGLFEALQARFNWGRLTLKSPAPVYLHQQEALGVYLDGDLIGGFGALEPELFASWDFDSPLGVLELDLSFLTSQPHAMPDATLLSEFPAIQIDMAFVVDADRDYADLRDHLLSLRLENLESLGLFDVYAGKSVGAGKKSLGFRFTFRSGERTLTGDEVSQTINRAVQTIQEQFGATVRQ